jgi:hypothetical protein
MLGKAVLKWRRKTGEASTAGPIEGDGKRLNCALVTPSHLMLVPAKQAVKPLMRMIGPNLRGSTSFLLPLRTALKPVA